MSAYDQPKEFEDALTRIYETIMVAATLFVGCTYPILLDDGTYEFEFSEDGDWYHLVSNHSTRWLDTTPLGTREVESIFVLLAAATLFNVFSVILALLNMAALLLVHDADVIYYVLALLNREQIAGDLANYTPEQIQKMSDEQLDDFIPDDALTDDKKQFRSIVNEFRGKERLAGPVELQNFKLDLYEVQKRVRNKAVGPECYECYECKTPRVRPSGVLLAAGAWRGSGHLSRCRL